MSPAFRRRLLSLHLWAGLTIGLVVAMLGLTGAGLVFRTKLEPRFNPEIMRVEPGPVRLSHDLLVANARAANPMSGLAYMRTFTEPERPVMIRFKDNRTYYVNPYTGTVLGWQNRNSGIFGRLVEMHRLRYLGEAGGEVTATCALIFTFVIITGIVLWVPATRAALKAGLVPKFKLTGRALMFNLHRTFAIYAALIVLTSAATGVPQAFEWAKGILYRISGSTEMIPPAPPVANTGGESIEAVWQNLLQRAPNVGEALLYFPKGGLVEGYFVEKEAPFPYARGEIWCDPAGNVIRFTPYRQTSAGFRLYWWLYSVHTGQVGGVVGQLLLLFGGLSVPFLAVTGLLSYLRRKSPKPAIS